MIKDCIFCKIIKGDIPSEKIYEDEHVYAFLDINPAAKGHTLVIPKNHSENITDIKKEDLKHTIFVVKKLAPKVMEAVSADGFNIGMNNFPASGQAVMHSHFHIIPRKKGDAIKLPVQGKYEKGEIEKVKKLIIQKLKNIKLTSSQLL
ncbi:HIT domain-containing protein [Candidatus Woesearchaeota archaeon]|nr:HIT domain-containing protein [Candidatus Woesearchaeota archaeon]